MSYCIFLQKYPEDSTYSYLLTLKGEGNGKIDISKELVPHSRTYELCGQEKKSQYKIKTNKHLTLPYKNYLQNRHRGP